MLRTTLTALVTATIAASALSVTSANAMEGEGQPPVIIFEDNGPGPGSDRRAPSFPDIFERPQTLVNPIVQPPFDPYSERMPIVIIENGR